MKLIHHFSEAELAEVAKIILNWGGVDYLVNQVLTARYGLFGNATARADLIDPLDLRKKVNLLSRSIKTSDAPDDVLQIVKLIAKACEVWSVDRNHLAHGISMTLMDGSEGIFSPRRMPMVTKDDIPKMKARSEYVADLSIRLYLAIMPLPQPDVAQGPLPERPD